MKAGDKVKLGGTTFIILKMVKCKENTLQKNDNYDYIRTGETYPVILEQDVNGDYVTYLIINRKNSKQYFNAEMFDEVVDEVL